VRITETIRWRRVLKMGDERQEGRSGVRHITPGTYKGLKKAAKERGVSMAQIICLGVQRFLSKK
jgi:hypothetical protein